MKKYANYIKWLGLLTLILVPGIGFALDAPSSPLWDMFRDLSFNPPQGDLSVSLLAKLFGYVPGVPQFFNQGATILSPIFGVFNAGVLAISGVFLSYTIFKVVTETTMEGTAMGKAASIWTAMRVGISTGLLIPQAGGYSLLNGIIMWVVIQSIGLADLTWSSALNYLGQGGSLTVSKQRETDYTLINWNLGSGGSKQEVGSADILRSLVCADTIKEVLQAKQAALRKAQQGQNQSDIVPDVLGKFSLYHNDPANKIFSFPYMRPTTSDQTPLKLWDTFDKTAAGIDLTGICGEVGYDTADNNYVVAKKAGLERMIATVSGMSNSLLYKADNDKLDVLDYVLYKKSGTDIFFAAKIDNGAKFDYTKLTINTENLKNKTPVPAINWPISTDAMLKAALQYQIALEPVQIVGQVKLKDDVEEKIEQAKQEGWITAGNYYYLLQNISAEAEKKAGDYRLQVYNVGESNLEQSRSTAPYGAFYSLEDGGSLVQAIRNLDPDCDSGRSEGKNAQKSKFESSMKEAFEWIWLSSPYTELRGKSLAASLAEIKAGVDKDIGKTLDPFQEKLFTWWISKDNLDVQLMVAAIAVAAVYAPIVNLASLFALPLLANLPMEYLISDVQSVLQKWDELMNEDGEKKTDPIMKLHELGDEMIAQSIAYFKQIKTMFIVITGALTAGAFVVQNLTWMLLPFSYWGISTGAQMAAQSSISVGSMIQQVMQTIMYINIPLGMAMMGPLFVTGITLSVYIPLIPYMLFLFGVISWFISVLVLMVAAPIICFLMLWGTTSQENPLLSREAEQFVMQIIGVFFRPTLMVIGLVVGIALSYIGVEVLNIGFAQVFEKVVVGNAQDVDEIVGLVKSVGFMVVYTFVMVSIVNMCFSTIHLLYSEVMRIAQIQAPAVGMEEKHMDAVKAGTTEFSQAGSAGAKESATTLQGKAPTPSAGSHSSAKKKGGKASSAE